MKKKPLAILTGAAVILLVAYLFVYEGIWVWIVENTDVPPNKMVILVAKTGKEMPPGQIIAGAGQKGVLLEPLGTGRHFINPFLYERQLRDQVVVGPGELGVVINKFGTDLPPGEFLAEATQRGIQRQVLLPGTYKLNPYAYEVRTVKMTEIEPGHVGVMAARSGKPTQNQLAEPGERGVQKTVLQPGLYVLNPEAYSVESIEVGFNQITMAHGGKLPETQTTGQTELNRDKKAPSGLLLKANQNQSGVPVLSAVRFPSSDGFEITIDVTLLWQLLPQDAPSVVSRYGNIRKIEGNILIPQINSTARIKGSTFGAVDFIVGDKREEFQRAFQETIETTLKEKKLQVDLALVQDTIVPENISGPIQDSRIAAEWNITNTEKTKTEAKKAQLDETQGKIAQIELVVEFETQRLEGNLVAEQEKEVNQIAAEARLKVAELASETAIIHANTNRKLGSAEAQVVELKGKAEGDGYALQVLAAGTAADYNALQFAKQLPDGIRLNLIYAGSGTLWTDLDKASQLAPMELLKKVNQAEPKPIEIPAKK
ncbi:MAG: SPFH domain-containing protein [Verrucomicrobiota bacterium]